MFVSIIIPVYQPGRFVRGCVASLQRQSFSDFEAIFIDDCGNDGSMEIIRRAAEHDSRFKILRNTRNLGQGKSRDAGIAAAQGEYVLMLDSDDHLTDHALATLYEAANTESSDIIAFSVVHRHRFSRKTDPCFEHMYRGRGRDFLPSFFTGIGQSFTLPNVEWFEYNKLIRRDLITNNDITHLPGRRKCEDMLFLLELLSIAGNVTCIPHALYIYNKCNANAITADCSLERFSTCLLPFSAAQKFIHENGLQEELGRQFLLAWDKYVYMGVLPAHIKPFNNRHNREVINEMAKIIEPSGLPIPQTLATALNADPHELQRLKIRIFKMRYIPLWLTKLKKRVFK